MIGLILANLLLIIASIYFIIMVKVWPLIALIVVVIVACGIYSLFTYKRHDTCHTYTMYDNCIIIHSVWADQCIHFEDIFLIETSLSHRDIKHGTKSLVVYEKARPFIKTNMPYISEDLDKLKTEILDLANAYKEKLNKLAEEQTEE